MHYICIIDYILGNPILISYQVFIHTMSKVLQLNGYRFLFIHLISEIKSECLKNIIIQSISDMSTEVITRTQI